MRPLQSASCVRSTFCCDIFMDENPSRSYIFIFARLRFRQRFRLVYLCGSLTTLTALSVVHLFEKSPQNAPNEISFEGFTKEISEHIIVNLC